ncbi:hypothetical protein EYF80_063270 [Liparis tanakae]|uniref:Uncharacterized protein n=1 Tax=Liparis tanakae TaxID=230148 RepID=A0A4Z2EDM0_9TELE|nr:hypothetical protein EYF80_063270 [Liparis tanakae]
MCIMKISIAETKRRGEREGNERRGNGEERGKETRGVERK